VPGVRNGSVVIVGGTSGIGLRIAEVFAEQGRDVVITGREEERASETAAGIPGKVRGLGLDLAVPDAISERLADLGSVSHLVLVAIERDHNTVRDYDMHRALRLVTLKLVGYTEVVHVLVRRLRDDASILVFGGLAVKRPYPGSTMVTAVNGGVAGLVRTLAVELAPIRVNGLHPGIVVDTPAWSGKPSELLDGLRARTPTGRLASTEDVVDAALFLLSNRSVNGVNLDVDGGWLLT
jgi:NAD(P)-dependent dehydrogenase (short-subunit alcohol dehydrogenase family)